MPVEIRAYVLALLQQTLADTVDLQSQVKQAFWTVHGSAFVASQALFATMAAELDAYADLVADRRTALGGVVRGTARLAGLQSR
jgi:starvation-inducible DNA-binding protein